jgi:hypothetical protein
MAPDTLECSCLCTNSYSRRHLCRLCSFTQGYALKHYHLRKQPELTQPARPPHRGLATGRIGSSLRELSRCRRYFAITLLHTPSVYITRRRSPEHSPTAPVCSASLGEVEVVFWFRGRSWSSHSGTGPSLRPPGNRPPSRSHDERRQPPDHRFGTQLIARAIPEERPVANGLATRF